jgi:small subunit ribosomal protein S4
VKFNGPKVKYSRKLGVALTDKAQRAMEKRNYPPGQHGMRRRRRQSNYGRQLLEKQRLRFQYNVSERQLRNYFARAASMKGIAGENLVAMLETRLDAFILRSGFAGSIFAARQVVNHGHIQVNGRRVSVPSCRLKAGDVVEVRERSRKLRLFNERRSGSAIPSYISVDESGYKAHLTSVPRRDEVPIVCEVPLVVEFYSR